MSHTLAELPNSQPPSERNPRSRSYQVDELYSAPSRAQNHRYILRTFILAPALVALAVYAIIEMPQIMSQGGALLNGTQSSPSSSGDSFLASASEWVPILLVLLSAAVLACMAFIALRERRRQRTPKGPELVQTPVQAVVTEAPVRAEATASTANSAAKPFLVQRSERRHAAREEIRLSRDARASAAQRAAEVSRLRITTASPSLQPLEAPEPEARFRTPPRRREPVRYNTQAAFAAARGGPLTHSEDAAPDTPPSAIA